MTSLMGHGEPSRAADTELGVAGSPNGCAAVQRDLRRLGKWDKWAPEPSKVLGLVGNDPCTSAGHGVSG